MSPLLRGKRAKQVGGVLPPLLRGEGGGYNKTELSQVAKGLEIFQIKDGKYPHPDEKYIEVKDENDILIIQGEIGDTIRQKIKISGDVQNDNSIKYTYSTNERKTKYSLTAYLEKDPNDPLAFLQDTNLTNQAYALDISTYFSKKSPYSLGHFITVFGTGENNKTPIEKIEGYYTNTTSNTGSVATNDLKETTGDNEGKINIITPNATKSQPIPGDNFKEEIEKITGGGGSGGGEGTLATEYKSGTTYKEGEFFKFGNKTWYVSDNPNVAYTQSSTGELTPEDLILVFENGAELTLGSSTTLNNEDPYPNAFKIKTANVGATQVWDGSIPTEPTDNDSRKSFIEKYGNFYKWGNNTPTITPATGANNFSDWGNIESGSGATWNNQEDLCGADGYIPNTSGTQSKGDWKRIVELVTGKILGWEGKEREILQKYLLLPLAGTRDNSSGDFTGQGSYGYSWSSSPYGDSLTPCTCIPRVLTRVTTTIVATVFPLGASRTKIFSIKGKIFDYSTIFPRKNNKNII